ncbi:DUF4132 domain-containing protein [Herbidospora sp. NBRC 101105]|uniref:DUF4132 domain-containing protein n=1 Tax=Herbidospora sp. NBRC 101105 TaxID=3032195 RepID=UPI00249FABCE|nr:DUF4132 domain-containing protein [Herbidospora sp. NBRC 101105]GLX97701.1 hypothetical protein Hesp01_56510 [Herbidospora sp. NBRC 101105]
MEISAELDRWGHTDLFAETERLASTVPEERAWQWPLSPLGETELGRRMAGFDDVRWRVLGLWAQHRLSGPHYDRLAEEIASRVARRKLKWTTEEADLLWRLCHGREDNGYIALCRLTLPLTATASLPHDMRRRYVEQAERVRKTLGDHEWPSRAGTARRLDDFLAEHADAADPVSAVRALLGERDRFAATLVADFGAALAAPEVFPLLRHWHGATAAKPSGVWLATAGKLLTPEAVVLVREILQRLSAHREGPVTFRHDDREWTTTVFLHDRTATPLRGLIWTCRLIDEPWVTALLGDCAVTCGTGIGGSGPNCRDERLANAAVGALAHRGGLDTVPHLARVQAKVRKKTVLAGVARALDAVAEAAGLSPERLLDRTVPTFGLGPGGVREEPVGDCLVRLRADTQALEFVNARGKTVKAAPAAIRKDPALAELKATLKDLRQLLPAERFRLERALIEERIWRWREVTEFFLDHPVTGLYARTLIWRILQGPAGIPVRTDDGWELTDPAGRRIQPDPNTPLHLWHPIGETPEAVRAWRDHLLDAGVRQPFKQAFREVYLLTPAEERTGTYSNRFAGHTLRYGQAKALLNQRGWSGPSIGHWDHEFGSDRGAAVKDLSGYRVRWAMSVNGDPEADGWGTASFCASEQIRFYRPDEDDTDVYGYARDGMPLTEVPPLVLSEALRDADLAVGVTSIGLDPHMVAGHEDYWHSHGFGELTETARTRRDALARLLPRLSLAGRAELTDRFLRVRGDLRTYKIHLGSGNILMEPNDAYLCIVPGPDRSEQPVFLPFEEDGGMLSIILSKAFLLAGDTAITDPTITRQIGG